VKLNVRVSKYIIYLIIRLFKESSGAKDVPIQEQNH
jgi:hypothetical protein